MEQRITFTKSKSPKFGDPTNMYLRDASDQRGDESHTVKQVPRRASPENDAGMRFSLM